MVQVENQTTKTEGIQLVRGARESGYGVALSRRTRQEDEMMRTEEKEMCHSEGEVRGLLILSCADIRDQWADCSVRERNTIVRQFWEPCG